MLELEMKVININPFWDYREGMQMIDWRQWQKLWGRLVRQARKKAAYSRKGKSNH